MCRACLAGSQQSAFSVAKPKGTFFYVPCSCNPRRCLSGPDSSTQCTGQICTAVAIAFIQGKAFGLSGVVTCCRTVVGQAGWGSGFVLSMNQLWFSAGEMVLPWEATEKLLFLITHKALQCWRWGQIHINVSNLHTQQWIKKMWLKMD